MLPASPICYKSARGVTDLKLTYSFNDGVVHWLVVSTFSEKLHSTCTINSFHRVICSSALISRSIPKLTPNSLVIRNTLTTSSQERPQGAQIGLIVFSIQTTDYHIRSTGSIFSVSFTHWDEGLTCVCVTVIQLHLSHRNGKGLTALER
jgi:hypothetical protein